MHVALSRFYVLDGDADAVAAALTVRPHEVDATPGFVSMWSGRSESDAREFLIEVRFESRATFDAWHHSPAFRTAHAQIPPGIRLDPARTGLTRYDVLGE